MIENITDPTFLKKLSIQELEALAQEIRVFLIENIAKTGGHLSSNLGTIELTIALHYVFNSPIDKIFFDVGHQSYTHKILTGRANKFNKLRQYQGLSGFQKRDESIHDVWEAGHTSTALSAAVAMAVARDYDKHFFHVVPVIGDASIVGGESFEALNHLGSLNSKTIIILNDNQMSISQNVGGINEFLSEIRTSMTYNKAKQEYKELLLKSKLGKTFYIFSSKIKNKIKGKVLHPSIFREFGVDYLGPIDGHDFKDLIRAIKKAKIMNKSVVVHVITKKGKGYQPAEEDQEGFWHGVAPFDIKTSKPIISNQLKISYSQIISNHIYQLMQGDKNIMVITPAMISGSKLETIFRDFPERSFDVGIAEAHATTFAAGLAISGKKPYLTMYSSFMQRAYDQINHDVARMNLPVVFGIDRSGLVGEDGETHHGVFDFGILKDIPNLVIFTPSNVMDAKRFLNTAFKVIKGPAVIRFPKENLVDVECDLNDTIDIGKWKIHNYKKDLDKVIIAYGENISKINQFIEKENLDVTLIDACFLKPFDTNLINQLIEKKSKIMVYETILKSSSLTSSLLEYSNQINKTLEIKSYGIGDHYTPLGSIDELIKHENLCLDDLKEEILEYFK